LEAKCYASGHATALDDSGGGDGGRGVGGERADGRLDRCAGWCTDGAGSARVGVQIYRCTAANGGLQWTLEGPDAKLLDADGKQIGTHFAGPTWKLTDGSQVQGTVVASQMATQAGVVPWLLLRAKPGTATGQLADVAYIQRTETEGGGADASACRASADAGKTARVPYLAKYTFYSQK